MRIKIVLLILTLVGATLGQPPPMDGGMSPKNMEAVRIWKLTEVLELTEDQVITFLPLVQIHERELKKVQKEIVVLAKETHVLLEKGDVSQKEVNKYIKMYMGKQNEIHKIKNDFVKSLPEYLTPAQQLRYLNFETQFRSGLREYMKHERRGGKRTMKRETKRK